MSEKEKAEQLVDELYKCMPFKDVKLTSCDENAELIVKMERLSAKQCALICVREIQNIKSVMHDAKLSDYYENLEQEIENL